MVLLAIIVPHGTACGGAGVLPCGQTCTPAGADLYPGGGGPVRPRGQTCGPPGGAGAAYSGISSWGSSSQSLT